MPDGHHLARGLHLGAQAAAGALEFVKGPLGKLDYHVVQGGLETGAGLAGDVVQDLVQGIAQGDAGGDLGDGIAAGLAGQGRGAAHPGIDLDDRVFKAVGVQGKLAVAAAHDADGLDHLQGGRAQHLVFFVCQRQGRGYHHAVAGVDAHGVHVFHGAHGDGVAQAVPHGLKFNFLPARDAFFHQYLGDGGGIQAAAGQLPQLLCILSDAASRPAQGIGRAHDDGVADPLRRRQGRLYGLRDLGGHAGLADLQHGIPEQLPVLRPLDGVHVRTQQPHAVFLQGAVPVELHGQRQRRLPAQARQQAVRPLLLDDAPQGLGVQGLQVDFVRQVLIGHDGGGVAVDQHHVDALLPQHPAGLGPGVIEFRRLADDDGPGADHQHLAYGMILRHGPSLPSWR